MWLVPLRACADIRRNGSARRPSRMTRRHCLLVRTVAANHVRLLSDPDDRCTPPDRAPAGLPSSGDRRAVVGVSRASTHARAPQADKSSRPSRGAPPPPEPLERATERVGRALPWRGSRCHRKPRLHRSRRLSSPRFRGGRTAGMTRDCAHRALLHRVAQSSEDARHMHLRHARRSAIWLCVIDSTNRHPQRASSPGIKARNASRFITSS